MKKIFLFYCLLVCMPGLKAQEADTTIDNKVFTKVDVEAGFPGGIPAWGAYLRKNLDGNVPVDNNAPMGTYTVIVRFIVSKTGSISDIVAETKVGYGMEREVIRIISKSPYWTPAIQNKKPVNAYRRQPVTFVVIDDDIDIQAPKKMLAGKENKITVKVNKFQNEDIDLTVDNGTVVNEGNGSYKLVPATAGKVIISITGTKKGKKVPVGSAYFPVE